MMINNKKFKLLDYLDYRNDTCNNLSINDIDKIESSRETMGRNIRNLLKNFNKDYNLENFDIKSNINILNYFPFYQLKTNQQYQFLDNILKIKSKQDLIGNKFISNIKKTNFDNIDINDLYITPPKSSEFQRNLDFLKKDFIKDIKDKNFIFDKFNYQIDALKSNDNLYDLYSICDLACVILVHILNCWVFNYDSLNQEKYIKKLQIYLNDFEIKVRSLNIKINNNIEFDNSFISFIKFYNQSNNYAQIINILLKEQKNSPKDFKIIKPEHVIKRGATYKDFDNFKDIICEGENIYEFNIKFSNTQKVIQILQNSSSNVDDLYDLKVYFREIYIHNSKYKTKTSTLIRKLTENNFDNFENSLDYVFFNEKISRGYFREDTKIKLYNKKVKLQLQIYKIISLIILSYNYKDSLDLLQEFLNGMFTIFHKNFKKTN